MGTSKRNLNEKIKKMLLERHPQDIKTAVPYATSEVITEKELTRVFREVAFNSFIAVGISGINGVRSGELLRDLDIDEIRDERTLQEVIEKILDIVDETIDQDFSELMLRAFKLALTITLKEERSIFEFVTEFCFYLIFLMVQGGLIEAFGDVYTDVDHDEINGLIREQIRAIVEGELLQTIQEYVNGKNDITLLIKKISEKASSLKIGQF